MFIKLILFDLYTELNDSATTSEAAMNDSKEDAAEDQGMDDGIGADGVTSQGEKVQNEEIQVCFMIIITSHR